MTKNLKDLEIKHLFLILSHNDQNIGGTEIVPYRPIKSLIICSIVPNFNVFNHYYSHTEYFLLIADVCIHYIKYVGVPIFQFYLTVCDSLK